MKLSDGEKLILLMLCEIQDHLKTKGMEAETDTKMIKAAIFSGNLWGLKQGMPGVFHNSETPDFVVSETIHIMAMWQRLEESFNGLSEKDKKWLADNSEFGNLVHFTGFDNNSELEVQYISAGHFLIDHLDSFQIFKGRDLQAHMPTLATYRRMLPVFDPILHEVTNRDFSAKQIAQVMDEFPHPERRGVKK